MKRQPAGRKRRAFHRTAGRAFGVRQTAGVRRSGGNVAPWFLKEFGSRPAHKLKPSPTLAQVA